jgi:hypothetical protein
MTDYLSSHVLIIALTFFLAGIVKGVAGMGLPTFAMGMGVSRFIMQSRGFSSTLLVENSPTRTPN